MRRCTSCGELTNAFEARCQVCHYVDSAWAEALAQGTQLSLSPSAQENVTEVSKPSMGVLDKHLSPAPCKVVVPLSSFSDSAELAYELSRIDAIARDGAGYNGIEVHLDLTQLGFDWEAAGAGEEHEFIPGSVGILAVAEACRTIQFVRQRFPGLRISAALPPEDHAASIFLREAGVLATCPGSSVTYSSQVNFDSAVQTRTVDFETIVPFTGVDASSYGQLSDVFHTRFDALADKGSVAREYRSPLRQVVMDLAENGSEYGKGCWVGCFLRQEKGRSAGAKGHHDSASFDPRQHTHLFINCFTVGPSLAEVTGHKTEWEAAQAVLSGSYTSRSTGGGSGMESIMSTVVESARGTVYLNSRNYARIVSPNGIVHEYILGGDQYLPGVHTCLLVPLAAVAQLRQRRSA